MTGAQQFGQNVCMQRRQRRWSMTLLAKKAGISRNALTMVEWGTTNPTLSTILALAKALDLPPAVLMEGLQ